MLFSLINVLAACSHWWHDQHSFSFPGELRAIGILHWEGIGCISHDNIEWRGRLEGPGGQLLLLFSYVVVSLTSTVKTYFCLCRVSAPMAFLSREIDSHLILPAHPIVSSSSHSIQPFWYLSISLCSSYYCVQAYIRCSTIFLGWAVSLYEVLFSNLTIPLHPDMFLHIPFCLNILCV